MDSDKRKERLKGGIERGGSGGNERCWKVFWLVLIQGVTDIYLQKRDGPLTRNLYFSRGG
jgi:hypothetical protein